MTSKLVMSISKVLHSISNKHAISNLKTSESESNKPSILSHGGCVGRAPDDSEHEYKLAVGLMTSRRSPLAAGSLVITQPAYPGRQLNASGF
jgi:hypothetical protein